MFYFTIMETKQQIFKSNVNVVVDFVENTMIVVNLGYTREIMKVHVFETSLMKI